MNFAVIRIALNMNWNLVALVNYEVPATSNASDAVAGVILTPTYDWIKDFIHLLRLPDIEAMLVARPFLAVWDDDIARSFEQALNVRDAGRFPANKESVFALPFCETCTDIKNSAFKLDWIKNWIKNWTWYWY